MDMMISLAEVGKEDRLKNVQEATEKILAHLRSQFPEADDYQYKQTEANRPVFKRFITVRRGLNWGFLVQIAALDNQISIVKLKLRRTSKLSDEYLGSVGFLGVYALLIWIFVDAGAFKGKFNEMFIAAGVLIFLGIALGVGFSIFINFIWQPLNKMKLSEVNELMNTLASLLQSTVGTSTVETSKEAVM